MSEDKAKRVVLVGHCRPDQFMMRSAVQSLMPDADVRVVNDPESLGNTDGDTIYLVNRVLDGMFESTDGIAMVERLAADGGRAMLISNLPEALAESESRGGLSGFGKSDLRSDRMRDALLGAAAAR